MAMLDGNEPSKLSPRKEFLTWVPTNCVSRRKQNVGKNPEAVIPRSSCSSDTYPFCWDVNEDKIQRSSAECCRETKISVTRPDYFGGKVDLSRDHPESQLEDPLAG